MRKKEIIKSEQNGTFKQKTFIRMAYKLDTAEEKIKDSEVIVI